jgi:hypothetical protein
MSAIPPKAAIRLIDSRMAAIDPKRTFVITYESGNSTRAIMAVLNCRGNMRVVDSGYSNK